MDEAATDREQAPAQTSRDTAPLKLEEFLPYRLNVLANLVSQALSRIYVERYGLGVPEWRVLVTLGQFGVMTGKAIGAHSHMHKTKVSRAVALLEKRKLLSRRMNQEDMREALLSLTPAGRGIYQDLVKHDPTRGEHRVEPINCRQRCTKRKVASIHCDALHGRTTGRNYTRQEPPALESKHTGRLDEVR